MPGKQQIGPTLEAVLTADISKFEKKMTAATKTMTATAGKLVKTAKWAGLAIGVALAGGAAASIKAFADFDQAMTKSTAIMGDMSTEMRAEMESVALTLSGTGVQSATDLAEAYFFLASAGLSAEESIAALPTVQAFATAGSFDMATATDLLTDAQTALGMSSGTSAENLQSMIALSDQLVKANTAANATVQQFSESLTSDAGVAARGFGMELTTTMAVLNAYASAGKKGAEAGNLFGRATRLMASAAQKNAGEFKAMGIQVTDQDGNYRNFIDIIADMEDGFEGMSESAVKAKLSALGFEALAQKSITPLLGMSGAMKEWEEGQKEAAGFTKDVASKQLKSLTNQFTMLKNKIVNVAIVIGRALAPAVSIVLKWITKVVIAFQNFVLKAIGLLKNFRENWRTFIAWVDRNWFGLMKDLGNLFLTMVKNAISNWLVMINTIFRMFTALLGWISQAASRLFAWMFSGALSDAIISGLKGAWDIWQAFIFDLATSFINFADNAWKYFKEQFTGGDMEFSDIFSKSEGTVGNFSKSVNSDFQLGKSEAGLISALGTIIGEQTAKLKFGFAGFKSSIEKGPEFNFGEEGEKKKDGSLHPSKQRILDEAEAEKKKKGGGGIGGLGDLTSGSTFSGRLAGQIFGANKVQERTATATEQAAEDLKELNARDKRNDKQGLPVGGA